MHKDIRIKNKEWKVKKKIRINKLVLEIQCQRCLEARWTETPNLAENQHPLEWTEIQKVNVFTGSLQEIATVKMEVKNAYSKV